MLGKSPGQNNGDLEQLPFIADNIDLDGPMGWTKSQCGVVGWTVGSRTWILEVKYPVDLEPS